MGTKTNFHKSAGFGGVEIMNEDESVFRTLSRFMCVCVFMGRPMLKRLIGFSVTPSPSLVLHRGHGAGGV